MYDKNGKYRVELPDGASVDEFKPLNTMNRSFYASEWEEAQKYKTSNVWDTIQKLGTPIILGIIAVMILVYYGDIVQPVADIQKEQSEQLKMQQDIAEKQSRMMSQLVREYVPEDEQLPENTGAKQNQEDDNG